MHACMHLGIRYVICANVICNHARARAHTHTHTRLARVPKPDRRQVPRPAGGVGPEVRAQVVPVRRQPPQVPVGGGEELRRACRPPPPHPLGKLYCHTACQVALEGGGARLAAPPRLPPPPAPPVWGGGGAHLPGAHISPRPRRPALGTPGVIALINTLCNIKGCVVV